MYFNLIMSVFAIGAAIKGWGYLLGFGFKNRNKRWSSEGSTLAYWKRKGMKAEVKEYFPEDYMEWEKNGFKR